MSATNLLSNFTPFSLTLPNNACLTGISHIPPSSAWKTAARRPLIVALHGGTCTAHHYDITPEYTSSIESAKTAIPIVAINRPCYAETSSFLPLKDGESFFKETANWLHEYILPKIWEVFAVPNNCDGVVLLSHSMAVPPSIITAALYASTSSKNYMLSGMILSGYSCPGARGSVPGGGNIPDVKEIVFPPQTKRFMMVSEPELNCADTNLLPLIDAQTAPFPIEELLDGRNMWDQYWWEYAEQVEIPVLHCMGEHDWLWKSDQDSMEKFQAPFTRCKRFHSAVVPGACHALEMGWKAGEWYETVFRFAQEVCEEDSNR